MRLTSILLLSALLGCGESEEAPAPIPPKAAKAKAKAKAEPEAEVEAEAEAEEPEAPRPTPGEGLDGFQKARSLTAARRHREAVKELEALLPSAGDEGVWRLLFHSAQTAGEGAALLDRLDADTAIGGQDAAHQRLRADLALANERPEDAKDAALKLGRSEAELGAVYLARALQAGATHDLASLDLEKPEDALVLAAAHRSASTRKKALAKAAPATWQGKLLLAELQLAAKDAEAARESLEAVLADADPEAALSAHALALELHEDRTQQAIRLGKAAEAAETLGLAETAVELSSDTVDLYLLELRSDEAESFAEARRAARWDAVDDLGAAQLDLVHARAAMHEGHYATALTAGTQASQIAERLGDEALLADASWTRSLAAYGLGLEEPLDDAAPKAGERADEVRALSLILKGRAEEARVLLADSKLSGEHGVRVQLAGARAAAASGEDTSPFTRKAVQLATDELPVTVRIEALLEQERYASAAGGDTATPAKALAALADSIEAPALATEAALRNARAGRAAELGDSPWAASYDKEAATPEGEDLPSRFSAARVHARAKAYDEAFAAYSQAFAEAPAHHRGPWAPVTVQDGRSGPDFDQDAAVLVGKGHKGAAFALLRAHDWWRASRSVEAAFAVGDDPSVALSADQRIAYNDAHARVRAQQLRWLAGAAEPPTSDLDALAEADAKALEDLGFARAIPELESDYEKMQEGLKGLAVLSYRLGPKSGDAVVVTADGTAARKIAKVPDVHKAGAAMAEALQAAKGSSSGDAAAVHGNTLRVQLIEPFANDLTGVGRYLVLADAELWHVSMSVLPEQQSGRRFLADIRTISYASTTADGWRKSGQPDGRYIPEYLGMSFLPSAESVADDGTPVPTETENTGRHFDAALRLVVDGDESTVETFKKKAPNARLIHLSSVGVGDRGALLLGGGELALHEVRELDLSGRNVTITGDQDPEVTRRWAQAFRAAGCETVITTTWDTPTATRSKYIYTFHEALIQHGSPTRALLQARQALREEQALRGLGSDPSWWGGYLVHGQP